MKIIFLAIAMVLTFQNRANAGVLLEPYLGYQAIVTDLTLGGAAGPASGQTVKIDGSGIGFGVRAGFALPLVFVALDYSSATLKSSVKDLPAGVTFEPGDQARTSLGITAGLDFPIVRPYLGYILDDQSKGTDSTLIGTGLKLGVGFSLIPMLKLNAEYQTITYTKMKTSTGDVNFDSSGLFSSSKASGFFITLSVPLEF